LHALGDDGAVGAEDAARARTLALWARLAALHRQLADAYDDLLAGGAEDLGTVDKRLDESSDSRHITSVKCATTNAPAPPRRMLSATALATLLDVDAKTIRRWRGEGKLPEAVVVGGIVRWRPEDVDAWLEEARG
jgi:predicted DNA-binding transcriptional regulator AlpA